MRRGVAGRKSQGVLPSHAADPIIEMTFADSSALGVLRGQSAGPPADDRRDNISDQ